MFWNKTIGRRVEVDVPGSSCGTCIAIKNIEINLMHELKKNMIHNGGSHNYLKWTSSSNTECVLVELNHKTVKGNLRVVLKQ